ncbi:MAG: hypothetical protein QXP38_02420 [Nitrososphaerota archaeon]
MDIDVDNYELLKESTKKIMIFFIRSEISNFDIWSTANRSYHIHTAFTFGPDFRKRFSELSEEKKFGPKMLRLFLLEILEKNTKVTIDHAPIGFSDDTAFGHLIRAEMGPRKIGGKWFYKSFVTNSDEAYLPPEYPRREWPPDDLPPPFFPVTVFPDSLTDQLFEYADLKLREINKPSQQYDVNDYDGSYFNLPCIKSIFSGKPIERHTSQRGGNKGAKLVAIALYQDTRKYDKKNALEKATKISKQYKNNLDRLNKGDDFGIDELKNWYNQAWLSKYNHSCGEIINSFRTKTFDPVAEWCVSCPLSRKRRKVFSSNEE